MSIETTLQPELSADKVVFQVALPGPFLFPLEYLATTQQATHAQPGARVKVPFRNGVKIGLLLGVAQHSEYDPEKLKSVVDLLDQTPLFDAQHLAFLKWASQYYHEPIGEVVMAALPKKLRQGELVFPTGKEYWSLLPQAKPRVPERATVQQKLLALLQANATASVMTETSTGQQTELSGQAVSAAQLRQVSSSWRKTLTAWQAKGWVTPTFGSCWPSFPLPKPHKYPLNCEQQAAVEAVQPAIQAPHFSAFLLQGITGSGKTEVYLAMIEQALAQGKQALVMVPEIGLTPQMVARFQAYLQVPVATLHSGMNDAQRHCAWHVVREGKVCVLLGTRSAIFAPFANLGLCILDEEHDLSYKQQDGFRYSARDLLIRRASMLQVPVVLGSATPSLESLHNVQTGRFTGLSLHKRAGKAELPSLKVLDIRGESIQQGVSAPLKAAMQQHLEAGNQVLLFLNRRGFAPVLMCHECGWQMACPSCDANMTYHQGHYAGYLQCHHCDYQATEPAKCPECGAQELVKVGQGTERLEETIRDWFPAKTILRIDRDSTRLKGSMEKMTQQAKSGEADVLLGTQMLAKGHDFPNVTLVGLLEIDQGLFSCDFRATERLSQLIVQVAGRAGRGDRRGEVLIQSRHPQNPLLTQLIKSGYHSVSQTLLKERKSAQLPPFGYQILIRAEAYEEPLVREFLGSVKGGLELAFEALKRSEKSQSTSQTAIDFRLWGPIAAPMLRRQGRYRYQLMLNSFSRQTLHQLLSAMEPAIYKSRLSSKVRWSIDVDPQEML